MKIIICLDVRTAGISEEALLAACGSALHHMGRKSELVDKQKARY